MAADGTGVHGAEAQHNVGHVQIRLHSRKISKVFSLRLDAGPHVLFRQGAAKVQETSRPEPFLERFTGRRRRGPGQRVEGNLCFVLLAKTSAANSAFQTRDRKVVG